MDRILSYVGSEKNYRLTNNIIKELIISYSTLEECFLARFSFSLSSLVTSINPIAIIAIITSTNSAPIIEPAIVPATINKQTKTIKD